MKVLRDLRISFSGSVHIGQSFQGETLELGTRDFANRAIGNMHKRGFWHDGRHGLVILFQLLAFLERTLGKFGNELDRKFELGIGGNLLVVLPAKFEFVAKRLSLSCIRFPSSLSRQRGEWCHNISHNLLRWRDDGSELRKCHFCSFVIRGWHSAVTGRFLFSSFLFLFFFKNTLARSFRSCNLEKKDCLAASLVRLNVSKYEPIIQFTLELFHQYMPLSSFIRILMIALLD